ncbi:MAG TPA: GrlR family regulatory protein [Terriglobales bacterium]|nr:GrlR family regulatory protein [Terriglobales bacterium]
MVEGFWILEISTPQFHSGGVAIFVRGKMFGGDNGFTWMGPYQEAGSLLKARVAVHRFDRTVQSILGNVADDFEMQFAGNLQGDVITGTAMISGQPQQTLTVRLSKKANL